MHGMAWRLDEDVRAFRSRLGLLSPASQTRAATTLSGALRRARMRFVARRALLIPNRSARSKDILSRWTFPLVPDDNHPGGHAYEHLRGNKYIAKDNSVVLSR